MGVDQHHRHLALRLRPRDRIRQIGRPHRTAVQVRSQRRRAGRRGRAWQRRSEWSRSLEDPAEYVLVEAFADEDAGAAHVTSAHFRDAQRDLPPHLAETPRIVNMVVPGTEWSLLGELAVDAS